MISFDRNGRPDVDTGKLLHLPPRRASKPGETRDHLFGSEDYNDLDDPFPLRFWDAAADLDWALLVCRAAEELGIDASQLSRILKVSYEQASLTLNGRGRIVGSDHKVLSGIRLVDLSVRLTRAFSGDTVQIRHWLDTDFPCLGGRPMDLIQASRKEFDHVLHHANNAGVLETSVILVMTSRSSRQTSV